MNMSILSKDHLGVVYASRSDMCKAWNINERTFNCRLDRGMTIEEALTTSIDQGNPRKCRDHLGNQFKCVRDMLNHYGITYAMFMARRRNGASIEEALTTPKYQRMDTSHKTQHKITK